VPSSEIVQSVSGEIFDPFGSRTVVLLWVVRRRDIAAPRMMVASHGRAGRDGWKWNTGETAYDVPRRQKNLPLPGDEMNAGNQPGSKNEAEPARKR
jgi:hypothetical protein